jgi:RND superfamily putative drug exporter
VLLAAAGFVVLAAVLGIHAPSKLRSGGFASPSAPSQVAADRLQATFGGSPNLIFVVQARSANVDAPAVVEAGQALTARLARSPGVSSVTSYWTSRAPSLRSRDGRQALVVADVAGDDRVARDRARALASQLDVPANHPGPVTVLAGGQAATNAAVNDQIGRDLKVAEGLAIPITALLLVVAFGSAAAALLPVAIGVLSIFATLFVLWVLGTVTDVSVYAVNLTTAMGLGLGIDYALLMVSRYREELANGLAVPDAVRASVSTAGRTIVFSAATVAAALAALLVFPVYFLRSFAYAGISVVTASTIGALVVLPALLAVLGHRVNSWAVPWAKRRPARAESPFWQRSTSRVVRHPLVAALPVVMVLVLVAVPFLHVHFGTPDDRVLPTTAAARQVGDALRTGFAADSADTLDVVTATAVSPSGAADYSRRLSEVPGVAQVTGPAGTWASGQQLVGEGPASAHYQAATATWFSAVINPDPLSPAAARVVQQARSLPGPGSVRTDVGGAAAALVDQKHDLGSRLPLALGMIALTTFIILFLFTGSAVLPLKALLLNLLSLTAVFGSMVWIFQYGHLRGILGFTPTPTSTTMPLLLFCIAFGLSMDYEVFMLSRIKELHDAGVSDDEAIVGGLARTGRIVTTAAGLLAVTFLAFGLSKVSFIQLFGIGTAAAILVDATLIRGVLVPSFMHVAGRFNWWAPEPLRRLHRRIMVADGPTLPEPAREPSPV